MFARYLIAAFLIVMPSPCFAGILQVGGGGAFVTLQQAVIAAQPGDVILLAPGTHDNTNTVVIDKPLSIIGTGSDQCHITAGKTTALDGDVAVAIRDLAQGEVVRVSGVSIGNPLFFGWAATSLTVTDCAGSVFIADMITNTGAAIAKADGGVMLSNAAQVSFDNCQILNHGGYNASASDDHKVGRAGLFASNSIVDVSNSSIFGADGSTDQFSIVTLEGGAAIAAVDSTIRVSHSYLSGGDGSAAFLVGTIPGEGGPAIHGTNCDLYLRGGHGNLIVGGSAGVTTQPVNGIGASAIVIPAGSTGTTTSDLKGGPGANSNGLYTAPFVLAIGSHTVIPNPLAILGFEEQVVEPGDLANFNMSGEAGALWITYFSLGQVPSYSVPGILGSGLIDPSTYASLFFLSLDGFGTAEHLVQVPAMPSLTGIGVLFQGLAAGPSGLISVSNPALLSVR